MKTKLFLLALTITALSFASTLQAQQVLKFENKRETRTRATGTMTFTERTTVTFRMYGGSYKVTDYITVSVGGNYYTINGQQTQQATHTFSPGTYNFSVSVSNPQPQLYYNSSLVISYIDSGNATVSNVPGAGSLYCDARYEY